MPNKIDVEMKVLEDILESSGLLKEGKQNMKEDNKILTVEKSENEQVNSLVYDELSKDDQKVVDELVEKTIIANSSQVIMYASDIQNRIAGFSEAVLDNVRTKSLGEVGDVLSNLVSQINDFDVEASGNKKGLLKFLKRGENTVESLLAKYSKVETNVDKIVNTLEKNKIQILKDLTTFEMLFEENLRFFKEVSLYIVAGNRKIEELKQEVNTLSEKANQTKEQMDIQRVDDQLSLINKMEKKVYDLKLTRMVAMQMAPQIRMLQQNDSELAEKIQSTLINTIPLWKSQLVLALGATHSKTAYQAQKKVSDTTNKLLKKNSELLKQSSIEIAKESERAIIDVETIMHTNAEVISTIEEVIKIHEDGSKKRSEAEGQLQLAEKNMKEKLLELQNNKSDV